MRQASRSSNDCCNGRPARKSLNDLGDDDGVLESEVLADLEYGPHNRRYRVIPVIILVVQHRVVWERRVLWDAGGIVVVVDVVAMDDAMRRRSARGMHVLRRQQWERQRGGSGPDSRDESDVSAGEQAS